jgi:hypothetical protein
MYYIPVHPARETSMHYVSSLGGPRCSFHKKRARTRYAELAFFASSGICVSRTAFWCIRVVECRRIISHAQVGPV